MMRYNAKVKLTSPNGAPSVHQVQKEGLSAAEILVLRKIHGDDAVTNIVGITNDKTPHEEERGKLAARYGSALAKNGSSMALLFGEHGKLPIHLPGHDEPAEDEAA